MASNTVGFSVSLSTTLVKRQSQHHRSSQLLSRRCFPVSMSSAELTSKQLLEAVRRESDESSALRVYEQASKQPNFKPSPALFHELLRKLARCGSLESMRSLLHEIPTEMVSEPTFLIFVDALSSFDLHEEIVPLLDAMESDFGVEAGTRFYNHVLNALVESNKLRLVEAAHSRMVRAGVPPDLSTFNVLIKALCRAHQMRAAMLMLEEMSIAPDETTFATIMEGFVEEGNVEGALRMRERMVSEYGCRGSNITVNVLVKGLCRAGRVGEALGLVQEVQDGFRPDMFTYNTLVNGLAQSGHVSHAMEVVDLMLQEGFDPDIYTYNSLISGHCKLGEIGVAMEIVTEMVSRKSILPDTVTYNTVIGAMCRERRVREARELVKAVSSSGMMAADAVTFNSLIQGLCLSGDHAGAEDIFSEMRSHGCEPDEFTYNMLMESNCSKGRVKEAMALLEEMERSGCPRNAVIYNTLIDGLCKNDRVTQAEEVFDEMEVRGVSRDAVTYNTLIDGLCKAGRVQDATQLMDQMMMEGLAPDKFTYNSLLAYFCRAGDMKRATEIVQSMGSHCEPDIVTYGTLVGGLCRAGRVDVATRLLRSLHIKGVTLTPKAYNPVVRALFKKRRNTEATRLFREMAAKGDPPPDAFSHNIVFRGLCQGGGPIAEAIDFAVEMMGKGFVPEYESFEMLADGLCALSMEDTLVRLIQMMMDTAALSASEISAVRGYLKIRKFQDALLTLGGALYKRRPNNKYPYRFN